MVAGSECESPAGLEEMQVGEVELRASEGVGHKARMGIGGQSVRREMFGVWVCRNASSRDGSPLSSSENRQGKGKD